MNADVLAGFALMMSIAAVIIVAIRDFHRPFRINDIRYAVLWERYCIALITYATICLFFYIMVFYGVLIPLILAGLNSAEAVGSKNTFLALTLSLSLISAMLVLLVVANTPFIRIPVDWIRRVAQRLARYPASVDTMTALIARSKFSFVERGDEDLRRELANYGIAEKLIVAALKADRNVLLSPAVSLLREVCSLYVGVMALRHEPRFRRFIAARSEVIDGLEREYRRLLRRAAQSIMLVDDLGASDDTSSDLVREMSDFIAEEAQLVRAGYQRLVAEAAVSRLSGSAARTALFKEFGYDVDLPRTLPIISLAIVFVLDWMIAAIPAFLQLPAEVKLGPLSATFIGFMHASALTMALVLAIYPKIITSFARPSLFSLPWQSYIVFGILAYLVGTGVMAFALNIGNFVQLEIFSITIPKSFLAAEHPVAAGLLSGLIFPITTIVASILVDWRLRALSSNFRRRRTHDGIVFALSFAVTITAIVIGIRLLSDYYGVPQVKLGMYVYVLFIVLFAAFGFVIGFVVPSTAEAHIKADKILFSPREPIALPPRQGALPQPGPAE